ncbi:MAG: 2,4-dihydroxyhept-2-ene-1,7-dioic acid aldolase [Myxococcales bacterium]|nr:2,4-dihydroxyhept-2-ene-1,7-dioic acid aldolase [Myxococcales bacterium]
MGLKEKLKAGEATLGSWITLGHPAIAEIMAKSGFDWLCVDLEHSVITIREAEELIRIIDLSGVTPLVRLSSNDAVQIKRVMDAGAKGIIVPMVNSVEDVERAYRAMHYPTMGMRGVGLARAQAYGADFEGYKERLQNESILIPQIEHIDAVNNIDSILDHDGVDGFIVGPYDLSGSLGAPGGFNNPKMLEAMEKINSAVANCPKPGGIHIIEPDPKEIVRCQEEGYKFLAYSLDIRILDSICREGVTIAKKGH